ncbi:phasin family protein [Mesorhizobium sp.]|uniref:phasin family protein n=1 Tax=Mesorhizobium sp. TaxID=1871066 RepID=UPI0025BA7095|nr:phasin family protein [Mesorhizobium sp.]
MTLINDASQAGASVVDQTTTARTTDHNGATIMQTQPDRSQFALQPSPRANNGLRFLLAAADLQAQAFKAMMRCQIETHSFLKHRCEQNVRLADDLVAGNEFNDAFDVLNTFFQNATSDYAIEAGRVASIGSKLASETAERVRKGTETTVEDLAASTVG